MTTLSIQRVLKLGLVLTFPSIAAAQSLVWSDEFNGTQIDPANWEHMLGNGTDYGLPAGWGNNELQYYTNTSSNSSVAGGFLHIVARQQSIAGYNYSSARLRSLNRRDFLYGRLEARMKLPSTRGIWPAFWMLPTGPAYGAWAASGEIDIVESVNIATTIYGTIHFGGQWPSNANAGGTLSDGTNFSQDFHVYSVEWEPDAIRWYVDGVRYYSRTSSQWYSDGAPGNDRAPFDQLFHFLINVAVGGNFPGPPDGTSSFPQELLVDWVRVHDQSAAQSPFPGSPHAIPGRIEAEDFDTGAEGVAYHDCDPANQGGAYRPTAAVDIEPSVEGAYDVGWLCANEWLEYTVSVASAAMYRFDARVASQATGGAFHVEFDGVDLTGALSAPATGGWQTWTTVTAFTDLAAGQRIMRFVNHSGTGEYNVNYFQFTFIAPEDLNRDGQVNVQDFQLMAGCMAGPGAVSPPGGCASDLFDRSDLDFDADVDLADYTRFQRALPV